MLVLALFLLAGAFGPGLAGAAPRTTNLAAALASPSAGHPLGTDALGRDVAARLLAGARGSVIAVVVVLLGCLAIGALVGSVAGWYGGAADWLALRSVDAVTGIPTLLLGLVMASRLGGSTTDVALALTATLWPPYVRVIRTEIRLRRHDPSNTALVLLGARPRQVLLRHVLPGSSGPVVVLLGITAAEVILGVATLSFLGLGAKPPTPEWGSMISDAQPYLTAAPWLFLAPAAAITCVVVAFNVAAAQAGRWFTLGESGPAAPARRRGPAPPAAVPPTRVAGGSALLQVRGLTVDVATADGHRRVVDGVDLDVAAGTCLALVGPSGSGKTMTATAMLGLVPPSVTALVGGSARLGDQELLGRPERVLRGIRGAGVAYIPQDVGGSLDPLRRVGRQIERVTRLHTTSTRAQARARAVALLDLVGIQDPARVLRQRPGELSGGMRQRVLIAIALAGEPALLVADEPTSSLDTATSVQVVELLLRLRDRLGLALLVITHDLETALQMAETVCVLAAGRVVQSDTPARLRAAPTHEVTRALLRAVDAQHPPQRRRPRTPTMLATTGLRVVYPRRRGAAPLVALAGLDLSLREGEVLGVVGRSGSGKSSLCRALAGVEPHARGRVLLDGAPVTPGHGLVQLVFQDPTAALDQRQRGRNAVAEALRLTHHGTGDVRGEAGALLERVGLTAEHGARRPWQLSGGERQRLVIARALAAHPRLLVLDEPVSSLDLIHRAEVIGVLLALREEGLTMVVVSHDLAVIQTLCDRVLVVENGEAVEEDHAHAHEDHDHADHDHADHDHEDHDYEDQVRDRPGTPLRGTA